MTDLATATKVALIVTETAKPRYSYRVALELDERLTVMGFESRIIDLADRSYRAKSLEHFDAVVFIGTNSGPMYALETHGVLSTFRQAWRYKAVATVMISGEKMLAESAELQLKRVLESLGASHQASLLVIQPDELFDDFRLRDEHLEKEIGRFLARLEDGIESLSILHDRLTA